MPPPDLTARVASGRSGLLAAAGLLIEVEGTPALLIARRRDLPSRKYPAMPQPLPGFGDRRRPVEPARLNTRQVVVPPTTSINSASTRASPRSATRRKDDYRQSVKTLAPVYRVTQCIGVVGASGA